MPMQKLKPTFDPPHPLNPFSASNCQVPLVLWGGELSPPPLAPFTFVQKIAEKTSFYNCGCGLKYSVWDDSFLSFTTLSSPTGLETTCTLFLLFISTWLTSLHLLVNCEPPTLPSVPGLQLQAPWLVWIIMLAVIWYSFANDSRCQIKGFCKVHSCDCLLS